MNATEQFALDRSLKEAYKAARRLCQYPKAHQATLAYIRELRRLGAKNEDD